MSGDRAVLGKPTRRGLIAAAAAVAATPLAQLATSESAAASTLGMVAARQRFFGFRNVHPLTGAVDPSKVILSWFGVTSFAMAFRGTVVLLDAWVPRGATSGYVPTSPSEVARLRPEAIFIGHGHFDHAADAATIAAATGALVVGTAEVCQQVAGQAPAGTAVRTLAVAGEIDAPGTRNDTRIVGLDVTVMTNVHSAPKLPDLSDPSLPLLVLPGLCSLVKYPTTLDDLAHLFSHAGDAEGGTLLFQFRKDDFALTFHDSSGPLPEEAPDLARDLSALPATTVQVGALQGFNQYTNGLRDPRLYIEALRPQVFVPSHHDNWLPLFTSRGNAYEGALDREIARLPAQDRPQVRFLTDPGDYLRPSRLTF